MDQEPSRVFISCGQQPEELAIAEQIRAMLQELGFDPWVAARVHSGASNKTPASPPAQSKRCCGLTTSVGGWTIPVRRHLVASTLTRLAAVPANRAPVFLASLDANAKSQVSHHRRFPVDETRNF